ncbi:MAG TPA: ABC transporter substrate-binding protein [Dehalococcoidia bacterium]|nr:ABC transporter substrate-binding protein [Dehalococcoidia bacterium]
MSTTGSYWSRFAQGRLSRRRALTGAAGLGIGAAALSLVGCGGGGDGGGGSGGSASTQDEGTPKPGGTYTSAFTGPFAGVDPHNSVYGGSGLVPLGYNYLLRTSLLAPQEGVIFDLAEAQELAADRVTTTFKIRQNVMINPNGTTVPARALDSEDVKLSFERVLNPAAASNGFSWLNEWVDKMDTPDRNTFRIVTKAPYAWVINNVGNNLYSAIVPKEWLTHADLRKTIVGGGPFLLKELTEGSQAVMDKNPTYWQSGKPYLDRYVLKTFADLAAHRTAFLAGQVDYYPAANPDEAKEILNSRKDVVYFQDPNFGFNSFWMNVRVKPWDDARVRRAVSRAINRDEYIQLISRGAGTPAGIIVPTMTGYALPQDELKTKLQPFNVQDAKQLFEAAGVKEFSVTHPTSSNMVDYVNIFVRQMQAAGVTVKPDPQDAGTWVAGYFQSRLTASLSLNQEYANPDFALHWYVTNGITGNGRYDTGFSDPEVDAAVKKAAGTLDETQRKAAYLEAQRVIYAKDPPFLNFFNKPTDSVLIKALKGVHRGVGSLATAFFPGYWLDRA